MQPIFRAICMYIYLGRNIHFRRTPYNPFVVPERVKHIFQTRNVQSIRASSQNVDVKHRALGYPRRNPWVEYISVYINIHTDLYIQIYIYRTCIHMYILCQKICTHMYILCQKIHERVARYEEARVLRQILAFCAKSCLDYFSIVCANAKQSRHER